jgi:hypothetical protein
MSTYTRAHLVRDSLVFQGKLLLDGLRDLALFPVSIVATLLDLFSKSEPPARHFHAVLKFGRRTEHWIGLFTAAERVPSEFDSAHNDGLDGMLNVDGIVEQIERLIVTEYERDETSGSAREVVDRTWRRIDRRRRALERLRGREDVADTDQDKGE